MRAAVVPRIGGKWEVREVPTPEPSANQTSDERNLICRSCFWCASHINKMNSALDVCPSCKDAKIESVPISFDETYRLDYDARRGLTLKFTRPR
jgi:hypothetical protein